MLTQQKVEMDKGLPPAPVQAVMPGAIIVQQPAVVYTQTPGYAQPVVYAQPQQVQPGYGQPVYADPYGTQQNPYGAQQQNPYGQQPVYVTKQV